MVASKYHLWDTNFFDAIFHCLKLFENCPQKVFILNRKYEIMDDTVLSPKHLTALASFSHPRGMAVSLHTSRHMQLSLFVFVVVVVFFFNFSIWRECIYSYRIITRIKTVSTYITYKSFHLCLYSIYAYASFCQDPNLEITILIAATILCILYNLYKSNKTLCALFWVLSLKVITLTFVCITVNI